MRSLLEKLNLTPIFVTSMALFFWLLSERGVDKVMVGCAMVLTVIAVLSVYFEFFHKPREVEQEGTD